LVTKKGAFDADLYQRAENAIAHGALTNSKRPNCLVKGVYPTHLTMGRGCHVWDTHGNRYVDYICGLGSNLLGYGNEEIASSIYAEAITGCTLSLGTHLEVEVAEQLKGMFPWVEQMRFLKTGTDACNAAIRIARGATGRKRILSEGYHGWGDLFVSMTPPAVGVAEEFHVEALRADKLGGEDIAAVIVEPVNIDASEERIAWMRNLRHSCTKRGILLIFDEVITGFRYPKWSVANQHGIEPDLICLGKAIANGMPLSVVAGKRAVMECGEYFVSSTFAGETCSLAAAKKTLQLLQTKHSVMDLWEQGGRFLSRFNAIAPELVRIDGYPTRGVFVGEMLNKALFWQEAVKAGILFGPSWFFNFEHARVTDAVISTCQDILGRVRAGAVKLEGALPSSPFAQRMREKQA
jgi:glutamate-1-semialdehyde 2,1-aminomutase